VGQACIVGSSMHDWQHFKHAAVCSQAYAPRSRRACGCA
jgi:hypothetical protein